MSMGKYSHGDSEHNRRRYSVQSPYIANHMKTLIRVGYAADTLSTHTSSTTRTKKRNIFSEFKGHINHKTISRHSKFWESEHESGNSQRKHSVSLSYDQAQTRLSAEQQFENSQPMLNTISYNVYNGMAMGQSLFDERKVLNKAVPITQGRGTFKDYCDQCTIHGLKYVGDTSLPKFERIFWMISVVIALFGSAFFIWNLYFKFTTSPIIISRAPESVAIDQIPFPAVTLCNMNNAKKSFAEKILRGKDETQKFLLKDLCDMEVNTIVSDEVKKDASESALIDQFLLKASHSCSDMLYYCQWNSTEMNCTNLFNPVFTDEGLCCNFNSVKRIFWKGRTWDGLDITWASDKHIDWHPEYTFKKSDPPSAIPWRGRGSGASHGLTIALDVNLDEYYCSSTASVGFKMLLHSPVETPQMREYGLTLSPGKETRVIITPHITDADSSIMNVSPKIRQCYFLSERRLRYYSTYTQRNCMLECEANFTLYVCHCMQYYMPVENDTRICDQTDDKCLDRVKRIMYDNVEEDEDHNNVTLSVSYCKCYPGCYEIDYSTEISQSMLVATFQVKPMFFKKNPTYFEKNIAIVHVFYVENSYLKYTKNELYGFVDLLSNTGGLLGLFMGFSLLSVTEILYYILLRICIIMQKWRREKKIIRTPARKRDLVYPFAQ